MQQSDRKAKRIEVSSFPAPGPGRITYMPHPETGIKIPVSLNPLPGQPGPVSVPIDLVPEYKRAHGLETVRVVQAWAGETYVFCKRAQG